VPQAPMNNVNVDVSTLAQLGMAGLRHGQLITAQSHPELMKKWVHMSARAKLEEPPQLILVQSDVPNAFTLETKEVVITTGLLKRMSFDETVAILGHELGHEQSEHMMPRRFWMGALGTAGALIGNEFGRHGGLNMLMHRVGEKWNFVEKARAWVYPLQKEYKSMPSSVLGSLIYISAGATVGAVVGKHLSVRPTELDADAKGAYISEDPKSLASALDKLQDYISQQSTFKQWAGRINSGYPSTHERVGRLQGMPNRPAGVETSPKHQLQEVASSERVGTAVTPALA
jgi:Zn-dependent protease with chaperone function